MCSESHECPQVKAVDVPVSSSEAGGKWLLRPKFLLIGSVAADRPLCLPPYWSGLSVRLILWAAVNEPLVSHTFLLLSECFLKPV